MQEFPPPPGNIVEINNNSYRIVPHPIYSSAPYGLEYGEATVYKLLEVNTNKFLAIKIFRPDFRGDYFIKKTDELSKFSGIDGLSVCDRVCLTKKNKTIGKYPELEYAILMPWVNGSTWDNIIYEKTKFSEAHSLTFAAQLSKILLNLEQRHMAHCDISSGNVMLDIDQGSYVELIDIEHLYYPHSEKPKRIPCGSEGYAHKESSKGLWGEESDRFASAILLAELLCWQNPSFRKLGGAEVIFPQNCIHKKCDQYTLAIQILNTISKDLSTLFEAAWISNRLDECPKASDWFFAIDNVIHPSPVTGWKKINTPQKQFKNKRFEVEEMLFETVNKNAPEIYRTQDQDGYSTAKIIRWLAKSTDIEFELQISKDKDFTKILSRYSLKEKEYAATLDAGIFYYRIRAINGNTFGKWSNTLKLVVNEK